MAAINWSEIWSVATAVLLISYQVFVLITIIFIILDNRKPEKTITWIVILILLPIVGLIAYALIGRNLRKEKLLDRKSLLDHERVVNITTRQLDRLKKDTTELDPDVRDWKKVIMFLLKSSKAILTRSNHVDLLFSGNDTFNRMLSELEQAQDHIHLLYYIFEDDNIGTKIKNILIEKARQGVEVRFIYDGVGSWDLSKASIRELRDAGAVVHSFLPVRFPLLTSKVNYRNHRKIVVIDGKIGYVGGINVADRYIEGNRLGKWRDTHLRIEGDAVKALQLVFAVDWDFVSNEKLIDEDKYFPLMQVPEKRFVQIAASGPDSEHTYIMETYFAAITSAQKNIYINTPYFIPPESIVTALKTAALGGIDVRIIIPKNSDAYWVSNSSMSYIDSVLRAGIKVYFYKDGFNHSKVMSVDGVFCSIGTANMDYRSFEFNLEVNAIIYDHDITRQVEEQFRIDLENSQEITLSAWKKRSLGEKFMQSLARIFSPLF